MGNNFDVPTNVGGGAYASTINQILSHVDQLVVSVKAPKFGAVGDGLTDDTTAIQEAIDAVEADGGGIVFFPEGEYLVTSELTIDNSGISLIGVSSQGSRIVGSPALSSIIHKSSSTVRYGIHIEKLGFDVSVGSGADPTCIRVQYVEDFTVRDCHFVPDGQWGLLIGTLDGADTEIRNKRVLVENCLFEGPVDTYEQLLVFNTEDITVRGCRFLSINTGGGHGIGLYQKTLKTTIEDCTFRGLASSGGTGIYYSVTSHNTTIRNCAFENILSGVNGANESDNGTFGELWSGDLDIEGCYFNTGGVGAKVGGVLRAKVRGNTFRQCGGSGLVIQYTNIVGIGTAVLSRFVQVHGNLFIENNQAAGAAAINPAVFILLNDDHDEAEFDIVGNQFIDTQGTPTQYHAVSCEADASRTLGNLLVVANGGSNPSGGRVLTKTGNITFQRTVKVYGNRDGEVDVANIVPRIPLANNVEVVLCDGSPEGVVAADPGSIALDEAGGGGSTLYVKEANTDATGWVAK